MFTRLGDSGLGVEFHFCPRCGSTVYWYPEFRPGWIGVASGCFDDQTLSPNQKVYVQDRLGWASLTIGSTTGG